MEFGRLFVPQQEAMWSDTSSEGSSPLELTSNDGDIVENVLCGTTQVVSHPGTSQYYSSSHGSPRGVSACGLAALNCVKKLLDKAAQNEQTDPEIFLKDLIAPETVEVSDKLKIAFGGTDRNRISSPSAVGGQATCTSRWMTYTQSPYSNVL